MFINISNHPSTKWSKRQLDSARWNGDEIIDIPFPNVSPTATTEDVTAIARIVLTAVLELAEDHKKPLTCLVQGESSLCFELSRMLLALGVDVVVATSERNVVEGPNGTKTVQFDFVQFRSLRG